MPKPSPIPDSLRYPDQSKGRFRNPIALVELAASDGIQHITDGSLGWIELHLESRNNVS